MSCQFLCSLWASLEHPLVICLMISVLSPHNLYKNLSDVLSMSNLIEFVLVIIIIFIMILSTSILLASLVFFVSCDN